MPTLRSSLIRLAHETPAIRKQVLQVLAASAMSESDFWRIVGGIGWGTKTTDYKAISKHLKETLTPEEVDGLRTTLAKVEGHLYKVITDWEEDTEKSCELGDDRFNDLIAHIVGLGKQEYDAVLRDPQKAYDRAHARSRGNFAGFKESFNYAIPYSSDF